MILLGHYLQRFCFRFVNLFLEKFNTVQSDFLHKCASFCFCLLLLFLCSVASSSISTCIFNSQFLFFLPLCCSQNIVAFSSAHFCTEHVFFCAKDVALPNKRSHEFISIVQVNTSWNVVFDYIKHFIFQALVVVLHIVKL